MSFDFIIYYPIISKVLLIGLFRDFIFIRLLSNRKLFLNHIRQVKQINIHCWLKKGGVVLSVSFCKLLH